ncbi:hypothetical protein J4402_05085 [Candidatus Pacearchaeota archaeon]|nr:hypothetical protein [Candidatus Pacearchaeota archaeon]
MQRKGAVSFWDYLAWIVLIGIAVWLILKISGIINTPLWLEYAPVWGAIYLAGWAMKKLDTATDDIKDVKRNVKNIEQDISKIKIECPAFKKKI